MSKVCVGIDLGGTNIKLAAMRAGGEIFGLTSTATPREGGKAVVAAMGEAVKKLLADTGTPASQVLGVGVGSPGPLNRARGVVVGAPNLPGFANLPVRDILSEHLHLPVVLENDANAAAYGEFIVGAGRQVSSLVMLTLGTGVGGGIVLDGKVWHGHNDFGGEIGHMIVQPCGHLCGCGQRGCLEQYASATFIGRRAEEAIRAGKATTLAEVLQRKGELDSSDVNAARKAGDTLAAEVWESAIYHLALGCVSLERLFDCELIVLSGGLTNAGDDLMAPLQKHYAALDWKLSPQASRLALAELGNDAGVIGAAGVAWQEIGAAVSGIQ